jgi:hypothetical protein
MNCYPLSPVSFVPTGLTTLQAMPVSSSVTLPSVGSSYVLLIRNCGPSVAYVAVGNILVIATPQSTPLLPGQSVAVQQGFATTIAAITASGTAELAIQSGTGAPNTDFIPCEGSDDMFGCPPLPSTTVVAAGTTQLTATVLSFLANALINSGGGGGVILTVDPATWNGVRPIFTNESGGQVTVYLRVGASFYGQAVNTGVTLQNTQSMSLSVSQSGAVLVQN